MLTYINISRTELLKRGTRPNRMSVTPTHGVRDLLFWKTARMHKSYGSMKMIPEPKLQ